MSNSSYWFKPKNPAWLGWYPVHWKGWALIIGFVVIDLVAALYFVTQVESIKQQPNFHPRDLNHISLVFILTLTTLSIVLALTAYLKCEKSK